MGIEITRALHGAARDRAASCRASSRTWCGSAPPASTSARSRRSSGRSRSGSGSTTCSRRGPARGSRPALTRVGGMMADIPDGWTERLARVRAAPSRRRSTKWTRCSPGTRSGSGRTQGVGVMSRGGGDQLLALRPDAARVGVAYDVRKDARTSTTRLRLRRAGRRARRRVRPLPRAAWRRCASRCGSSSRRSTACPTARSTSTTRASSCRPSAGR